MTSHSDDLDEMGEPHGDETPLHLRPMDAEVVDAFIRRANALFDCVKSLGREGLLFAAMMVRVEALQFGEPWERTPHMAGRLVKSLRVFTKHARECAEMQLAGVADGLALDIEAAVNESKGDAP